MLVIQNKMFPLLIIQASKEKVGKVFDLLYTCLKIKKNGYIYQFGNNVEQAKSNDQNGMGRNMFDLKWAGNTKLLFVYFNSVLNKERAMLYDQTF